MSVVIAGTFAIGWSAHVVEALKNQGYEIIGDPAIDDPFALLLERIKNPQAIAVMTKLDVGPKHPEVVRVLQDLARALLPDTPRYGLVLDADPHEYFGKCIADGFTGSFDESTRIPSPDYLEYTPVKRVSIPAHAADMPDILGARLARELTADVLET